MISSRDYLSQPEFLNLRNVRVFNLCKSYKYQTFGYYVSLLAEARRQKPIPNINTIQDIKSPTIIKLASEELEDLIQQALSPLKEESFTLSIYFGKNIEQKYDKLASHLFKLFHAPFLRA
ncbi:MAG: RimK-like ATPgrasp N-terminal domain-containing protein, partial [Nanoarchaeota archaeon]